MKKIIIILFCMFSLIVGNKTFAYNPNKAESGDFGSATTINADLNFQPGTGTTEDATSSLTRIYFGTQSCTGSGTQGIVQRGTLTGLPYIEVAARDGSTTVDFKGFTNFKVGGVAVAYGFLGDYVLATNGTQTGLVGTNTTHGGTNTIPSGAVFTANGRTLSDIEISYLDGLSDFLTTLLAAKQADLGGTYCASISDGVATSTGAISLGVSGDLTLLKAGNQFVFGQVGSVSAKPSTMENGGTVTASPAFIDYDGDDFDPVGSGTGSRIKLSVKNKGSSTAAANTVVVSDGSSTINNFTKDLRSGNDTYTKLLLHGDQVGSLSTYLDSSEQELTVTAGGVVNGTTTQSVFGGASLYFNGTGDRLSIADNTRLELGSNDFILEGRYKFVNSFASGNYLFTKEQTATTDDIRVGYLEATDALMFFHKSGGSYVIEASSGTCSVSLNTWYHFAWVRKGSQFRFYVDGIQKGSDVIDADAIVDNTGGWNIGRLPSDSAGANCYMDEIRMTIGTSRKPAGTFTVATEAYGSFTSSLSN